VRGGCIFPGAGYLELAAAAVRLLLGPSVSAAAAAAGAVPLPLLTSVAVPAPLELPTRRDGGCGVMLQCSLTPGDARLLVESVRASVGAPRRVLHMSCSVGRADAAGLAGADAASGPEAADRMIRAALARLVTLVGCCASVGAEHQAAACAKVRLQDKVLCTWKAAEEHAATEVQSFKVCSAVDEPH
jgi:hypothetical protein